MPLRILIFRKQPVSSTARFWSVLSVATLIVGSVIGLILLFSVLSFLTFIGIVVAIVFVILAFLSKLILGLKKAK